LSKSDAASRRAHLTDGAGRRAERRERPFPINPQTNGTGPRPNSIDFIDMGIDFLHSSR
jgi:hypothetical protein